MGEAAVSDRERHEVHFDDGSVGLITNMFDMDGEDVDEIDSAVTAVVRIETGQDAGLFAVIELNEFEPAQVH